MAKSKNGGTRAFIRGRIGSDVYSVGKDGKGSRQQVVRSLAEQVSNPRTTDQMFGRMIMSTVMQGVSALKPIIDHSFDGVATGQPSISEFIRRNYALVKADAIAHPSAGNEFELSKFQQKGAQPGLYIVSNGTVTLPAAVESRLMGFAITLTAGTLTVGGLKNALGLSADGYLTWVGIGYDGAFALFRAQLTTTLADSTAITAENVASLFTIEGNVNVVPGLDNNEITVMFSDDVDITTHGVIVSEKIDGAWAHNKCVLEGEVNMTSPANVALPTYPTGSEQFLNGGQL